MSDRRFRQLAALVLSVPAALLLAGPAGAQTTSAPAAADAPAATPDTVVVNGRRGTARIRDEERRAALEPLRVRLAKNKLRVQLSMGAACSFSLPGNPGMRVATGTSSRSFSPCSLGGGPRDGILRNDRTLTLAYAALDIQDYATALEQFKIADRKIGYEEAPLELGKIYLNGLGVPPDTAQAIKWLEEVIDRRYDPLAGRLHFNPATPEAMNPRCEAAMLLAKIYQEGIGIQADAAKARAWYDKAADFGYMPAGHLLATQYLSGADKNTGKALDYLKEAAEAGYAPSLYLLGKLYRSGEGVRQDKAKAAGYFVAAARAGNVDAMYAVGRAYDRGDGVAVDQSKAVAFYKDAAVQGHANAQAALATYFYTGELVPQNLATARGLFKAAAVRGQRDAMFNLGVMLAQGEGGPRDVAMSYVWLSLANASANGVANGAANARASAALLALKPQLSAQDLARADAILQSSSGTH